MEIEANEEVGLVGPIRGLDRVDPERKKLTCASCKNPPVHGACIQVRRPSVTNFCMLLIGRCQ